MKKWFKRKTYGWGWTPVSWEGWVVTILYVFIVLFSITLISSEETADDTFIAFLFINAIALLALFLICYITGEKPRWQWGEKDNDHSSDHHGHH